MKKITLIIFASMLILSACRKDLDVKPAVNPTEIEAMSEMKVSPDFNWKTDLPFSFQVLPNANSVLKVTSSDGVIYHKEYVSSGIAITRQVTLPTYLKEITLELAGQTKTIQVEKTGQLVTFD